MSLNGWEKMEMNAQTKKLTLAINRGNSSNSIKEKAVYVVQMQAEKETAVGRLVKVLLDNFYFLWNRKLSQ